MAKITSQKDIGFEEFARSVEATAVDIFMEHKKLRPTMFTYKDRLIQADELPMKKNQTQSPLLIVRTVLEKYQPQFWGVAMEGWVKFIEGKDEADTIQKAEEYRKDYKWGDIQKKETKKQECIQIIAQSLDGVSHYDRMFLIKRARGQVRLKRFATNEVADSETLPLKGVKKDGL